jgi:hypothetical protein
LKWGGGVRDYNRGVLACIGKLDLWHAWSFACVQADSASAAEHRRLDKKYGDDDLAKALDAGDAPELDEANARLIQAWKPIQSIIDAARESLHR